MQLSEDLNEYTNAEFRAEHVANALLKATTTKQDVTVDVNSALTRLKYDRVEVTKALDALCRAHHDELLAYASGVQTAQAAVRGLKPALVDVGATAAKLDDGFLLPYARATALQTAAERLHRTAALARALAQYLQLALQVQSMEYTRESSKAEGVAGTLMLRNATALVALERLVQRTPDLERVVVVSQFGAQVPGFKDKLCEAATALVHEFDGRYAGQVRLAVRTLAALAPDLPRTLVQYERQLAAAAAAQLAKAGAAAGAGEHRAAFAEAQRKAQIADTLRALYAETAQPPLAAAFWPHFATVLGQKLKTMSVTNVAALRQTTANRAAVEEAVKDQPEVLAVYARYLQKTQQ